MEKRIQKLLVIDDSADFLNDVDSLLHNRYTVLKAESGKRGLDLLESERVGAVLLDLKMPEMDGFEVLKRIHEQVDPHLPVIIVTAQQDVELAVDAIRQGATDFISKSFDLNLLSAKLLKALERRSLEVGVETLRSTQVEGYDRMVFASEAMKKVHWEMSNLAKLDFDILLVGETGVGKDLIAFEMHQRGPRRNRPFIPVPLRSLNESLIESELFGHEKGAFSGAEKKRIGKLEAAQGGTVYIPEVSSINEAVQIKLLQFMQFKTISRVGQDARSPESKLDVRVILATNEDLEGLVSKGAMRADFYHRIAGVKLLVPPLRERVDDIVPLAEYFLSKFSSGFGGRVFEFGPEVLEAFRSYRWPGNVRELENVIKNALAYAHGGMLTLTDFPNLRPVVNDQDPCSLCMRNRGSGLEAYRVADRNFKRAYFQELLRQGGNSVAKAAALAGLTPQGLRRLMNVLDIRVN